MPCKVLYSGISRQSFGNAEFPSPQVPRDPVPATETVLTFVLHCDNLGTTREFAWGVEIVLWENDDHRVRIGRVVADSIAERAGLQECDQMVAINGIPINDVVRRGELMHAMLSLSITLRIKSIIQGLSICRETFAAHGRAIGFKSTEEFRGSLWFVTMLSAWTRVAFFVQIHGNLPNRTS